MIKFDLWKDGKRKAATMSYDDGAVYDKRLVEIFDKNGIKGTFHLNSGALISRGVSPEEIRELYKNHEIAVHGVEHNTLSQLPPANVIEEVYEDRKALEKLSGRTIVGMSYANGSFSDDICSYLRTCGIVYSRTVQSTKRFSLPDDFLKWHPTCHHSDAPQIVKNFLKMTYSSGHLLYIWGHSHEFERDNNWQLIEDICVMLGNNENVWYATNIEIYDYVTALRRLRISSDNKTVFNPSACELWFSVGDEKIKIGAGETLNLQL